MTGSGLFLCGLAQEKSKTKKRRRSYRRSARKRFRFGTSIIVRINITDMHSLLWGVDLDWAPVDSSKCLRAYDMDEVVGHA